MFKIKTFISRPYKDKNYQEYIKRRNRGRIIIEGSDSNYTLPSGLILIIIAVILNFATLGLISLFATISHLNFGSFSSWAPITIIISTMIIIPIYLQPKFSDLKHGSYYSLNEPTWALTSKVHTKEILWRKVKKELTSVELENFKGVLPNFKGSIKDLMEVSKTI